MEDNEMFGGRTCPRCGRRLPLSFKGDGSATFTGKTRFEGGIGIVCDAKDIVRNDSDGLLTITYHFPMDYKIYDILLFLEPNNSSSGTALIYKFTCVQYDKFGGPAMDIFTTYDNSKVFGTVIEAKVEADNVDFVDYFKSQF